MVNAFHGVKPCRSSFSSKLFAVEAEEPVAEEPVAEEAPAPLPVTPAPAVALPAKWLPVGGVKAPKMLDGTMAGDAGFDPLGFAKSKKTLFWMREAELKHSRLAMLAAVGWPMSELLHKEIASTLNLPSILASGDRAPALLNGGLNSVYASGILIVSILVAGLVEGRSMNDGTIFWGADKPEGYVPGNLGFDPLNLKSMRKNMDEFEIKNGRLAMVAITAFAFLEASNGKPVTELTPFLF